jgi:hypothetical protein
LVSMARLRLVTVGFLLLGGWAAFAGCGADDDPGFTSGTGVGGTDASTGGTGGSVTGGTGGSGGNAGTGIGGVGGGDGGPCPSGEQICGQLCIDPEVDHENCGSCGHACEGNQACENGVCVTSCEPGQIACDDGCFDPSSNNTHCGSCDNPCNGGSSCQAGACDCPGTLALCDDACVDTKIDNLNCGGCGTVCSGGKTCTNSVCVCPTNEESCGGQCTDTNDDPQNCGSCGNACSPPEVCSAGACVLNCAPPTTKCGNACVNLQTDTDHCGNCTTVCVSGQNCVSGGCQCPSNGTLCAGQCVNTQSNSSHCGACNNACTGGKSCVNGACACPAGQVTCNGQCATLGSPCSDGNACTDNDSCQAAGCAGTTFSCADTNPCTADSCSSTLGCQHTPIAVGSCDDGDGCTTGDSCQAGGVCGGTCPSPYLLFVPDANVTLSSVAFTPQDIIAFDFATDTYSMYLDGSDVGVTQRIDAVHVMPSGQVLLSFDAQMTIAGLTGGPNGTTVEASDLVRFVPTSIGPTTAGSFVFAFDGSDVGIAGNSIDDVSMLPNGDYLFSLANGQFIGGLQVENEDVVSFTATSIGATTAGAFAPYFDHSATTPSFTFNVDGAHYRASDGLLLLSSSGTVTGVAEDEDVYAYNLTTGAFSMVFDGSAHGFTGDVNAISLAQWKVGCTCQ